eukprot:CAMPEP_0204381696 /NCGR_PEP_ID=MMETSP0469-20131031/54462_1 /ASSEMBLY_ACC=CAM_ASM_000384 /TAXON_ID=2969 /ORGANISM="Oxyrrhis marina" /LENGTH=133 /DNA_ID=CAMNT_0051373599 /DNA_START=23 /DNA_END=424 /DNA_ORIENTATION=+
MSSWSVLLRVATSGLCQVMHVVRNWHRGSIVAFERPGSAHIFHAALHPALSGALPILHNITLYSLHACPADAHLLLGIHLEMGDQMRRSHRVSKIDEAEAVALLGAVGVLGSALDVERDVDVVKPILKPPLVQ